MRALLLKIIQHPEKLHGLKVSFIKIYLIKNENNKVWKRHANQIISCIAPKVIENKIPSTILDPLQKIYHNDQIVHEKVPNKIVETNTNEYNISNSNKNTVENVDKSNNDTNLNINIEVNEELVDISNTHETVTKNKLNHNNNENVKQSNIRYDLRERKRYKKQ